MSSARSITVTITIGDKRVTMEGPEGFVRSEVRRLTESITSTPPEHREVPRQHVQESEAETDFVAAKRPSNHAEIVAVLAYSLRERGVGEFTPEDIKRAYLRARIRPPKVVAQAIRDAKNVFDYVEQGAGRGVYRLSHHGERTVVFDLPRAVKH
jgi:hypothetical protein